MQDLKMGGTEGFGIGLEVEQRLRGEEGACEQGGGGSGGDATSCLGYDMRLSVFFSLSRLTCSL